MTFGLVDNLQLIKRHKKVVCMGVNSHFDITVLIYRLHFPMRFFCYAYLDEDVFAFFAGELFQRSLDEFGLTTLRLQGG